jgi:hypothetical protein
MKSVVFNGRMSSVKQLFDDYDISKYKIRLEYIIPHFNLYVKDIVVKLYIGDYIEYLSNGDIVVTKRLKMSL